MILMETAENDNNLKYLKCLLFQHDGKSDQVYGAAQLDKPARLTIRFVFGFFLDFF